MFYTIVILTCILVFIASMFTGGKSLQEVRQQFYGNYYAEDALINTEDKPNSREAVLNCVENGIGIKTEVHLTKDYRVLVSTYADMSKEYGLDKNIADVTVEEAARCGVLSLTDLISLTDGKVPLILELKVSDDNQKMCRLVADAIKESQHNNIAVASFHAGMLSWYRDREKNIFRGVISAPPADFKNLSKFERFMTGNLGNNGNAKPNFMLYRNKPYSIFVKFALLSGVLNGVWTLTDAQEAKELEPARDMIVIRGFMPETVHFKDMQIVELTEEQKKAAEAAKPVRQRSIAEILADDELESEEKLDELKEEAAEIAAEIKEEITEFAQEAKEEISELKEKLIEE